MNKKDSKPKAENTNEDLPGYPHYPANEDILNSSQNNTERVPVDLENIARNVNVNTTIQNAGSVKPVKDSSFDSDESLEIVPGTSADVTADDLLALGDEGLSMDMGDDQQLRDRPFATLVGDTELDVPGAELDDDDEITGREDEENNYYSLGGDNHEK